jgi:hypothetical protein
VRLLAVPSGASTCPLIPWPQSAPSSADDGELGYVLQLYTGEIKFEFNPAPDVVALDVKVEDKTTHQLIIDLDFMTKKPIKVESFDVNHWLIGWQRAVNRDTDDMLNLAINLK